MQKFIFYVRMFVAEVGMGKVGNALLMLNILSSGKKYTIQELSSILETSPRMIRIYKQELEKAGIYIDTIYGSNGGYIYANKEDIKFEFVVEDLRMLERLRYLSHKHNILNEKELSSLDVIVDKMRYMTIISKVSCGNSEIDAKIVDAIHNSLKDGNKLILETQKGKQLVFKPMYINIYKGIHYFTGLVENIKSLRTYSINEIKNIKKYK